MVESSGVSLKCAQTLSGHNDRIWALAWNPQGDLLASCSSDKTIKIWGMGNDKYLVCLATLENEHKKTIRSICWTPDGSRLISAGFDSLICVWVKEDMGFKCVATMQGHQSEVKGVALDYKGEFLASCGRDKSIWIWEKEEGEEWTCCSILDGHSQDVKKITWIPNTSILASASYDNTIKFWTQREGDWACLDTLTGHKSTVWCIDFAKETAFLASTSEDQTVKFWLPNEEFKDKNYYVCSKTLEAYHDRPIYTCSWNYDGSFLATSGGDDKICLFARVESIEENVAASLSCALKYDNAHTKDINCVCFHPTHNILATCSDDNTIKLWLLNTENSE